MFTVMHPATSARTARTEMESRCVGRFMSSPFCDWRSVFPSIGAFARCALRPLQHVRKADAVVRVPVDHVDPGEKAPLHQILYTVFADQPPNGEDVVVQAAFESYLRIREFTEKGRHEGN